MKREAKTECARISVGTSLMLMIVLPPYFSSYHYRQLSTSQGDGLLG